MEPKLRKRPDFTGSSTFVRYYKEVFMSKENLFGNTIYRNQVNGVKVVFTCQKLKLKHLNSKYIYRICYKIAKKCQTQRNKFALIKKRYHRF